MKKKINLIITILSCLIYVLVMFIFDINLGTGKKELENIFIIIFPCLMFLFYLLYYEKDKNIIWYYLILYIIMLIGFTFSNNRVNYLTINNILKRYEKEESNKLQAGNVIIDLDASRVYVGQEEIVFTALEYKILVLLFSNMGKTVTRENILDKIWDVAGNFVNDNTLTVYVKRIRAKLGENDVIKTIKGIGYRVEK